MAAAPELLTPRLRLRPLSTGDAEAMAALITPGISRWTGSLPGTLSPAEAAERLEVIVQAMAAGDDVTLAIERRDAPGFIGWIGLRRLGDTPERAALGYWIGEAFHGQGYAREAAQAFLPAAWGWLDVDVVEAVVQHGNAASLAVLRGLGMAPQGERMTYSSARDREEACFCFEARRPAGMPRELGGARLAGPAWSAPMADQTAYDFAFTAIDGKPLPLSNFKGKAVLVVNTASQCGLTPQYAGLEALWRDYRDKGLVVLGTPSNDFGAQEPGTEDQIKTFCETSFGVDFPMTSKVVVKGEGAHPFYKWAKDRLGEAAEPKWNFHKILIGKDGSLMAGFGSRTEPGDPAVKSAIEAAL